MSPRSSALALALLLAACSGETYVVVTVQARPAVHGATTLHVALTNGGATLSNDLPLGAHTFPVTFSVSSPSDTGDLAIAVTALDGSGTLVGQGSGSAALDAGTAQLMLESADFVVNTEYAMDQFTSQDFEATGTQMAADQNQTWTVGFRDDCDSPCNMYARRFDDTGAPATTVLGAGTNQFDISTNLTDFLTTPTLAASMTTTLAIWDSHDDTTDPSTEGIACRALDATGNASDFETAVVTETGTDAVSAAALANGNYAVTWSATNTGSGTALQRERAIVVGADCTPIGTALTLNTSTTTDPRRSHVASTGNSVLYAWIDSGDLHVRAATTGNALTTGDLTLITHTATLNVEHVRVAPLGSAGYAVAVRWYSETDETVPGKIELYLVSAQGAIISGPTLVTAASGSDFASQYSFGLVQRADGALLVTWHACGTNGDGQGCGVFARVLRPSGAPVGDAFGVPTTTISDQTNPSAAALTDSFAVAWVDMSALAPDISGLAVRARVIYPPYDDAQSIAGATCGSGLPACASPLVCAPGSDGARCYEACAADSTCPDGGTCTAGACVF